MAGRVYSKRHKHLLFQTPYEQMQLDAQEQCIEHKPEENTITGQYDRRIIMLTPNGYLRPNTFSLFSRCVREGVFSFFLNFAGVIAVTDPTNTPANTATALALSFTLPQFIAQIASYGTFANPYLLFVNLALVPREILEDELMYCFLASGCDFAGGVLAVWLGLSLRGNVDAYLPQPDHVTDVGAGLLEFIFCFLYCYLYLKLVRSSPRNEPPVVDSPYSPITMAAFTYIGILTMQPFTGAGFNLIRTLAPALVTATSPRFIGWTLGGQFLGYGVAVFTFRSLYAHADK
jgi:glycerol uptake facilitator-like aquaporin